MGGFLPGAAETRAAARVNSCYKAWGGACGFYRALSRERREYFAQGRINPEGNL
ncbi:MAG: hypothetical protein ABFD97_09790 [Syntrophobacter sp.]